MNNRRLFPIITLTSLIVLVPLLRCELFFDSYLIKLWITQFAASILFIHFCYKLFLANSKVKINNSVILLLLVYLAINIISWFIIPPPHKYPALITLNSLFVYILLFFLVSQYINKDSTQNLIVSVWIITAIAICVYGIFWQFKKNLLVTGTLGNENFLGAYISITIPVSVGYFFRYIKTNKKIIILGLVIIGLFIPTLYLTHSRGAWIGLFGALTSFALIGWGPKGKRLIIAILLVTLIIVLTCIPRVGDFITTQFKGDVRPAIWESTIYMITEKPWLGWGKGAYFIFYPQFRIQDYWLARDPKDLTTHAHNEFLQIWSETGLAGLIVFIMFIGIVLKLGIRNFDYIKGKQKYILLGIISAVLGLLVHNQFSNNLQMPSSAIFLWFMLGMIISKIQLQAYAIKLKKFFQYGFFLALTLFLVIINLQTGIRPVFSSYIFKEGWKNRGEGSWDFAISRYNTAIAWYPWDVEMYYRAAFAYVQTEQYDKAIEKYDDVIRLAPLYGSVHRNLGLIHIKTGEYELAVKDFLQALRINENDIIAYVNLNKARKLRGENKHEIQRSSPLGH